ncbi:MAG: hypothetical protein KAH86_03740 [Methanosarcinales archaeon]|nr:hypothetical protein [Methanosarcinales archaeon]
MSRNHASNALIIRHFDVDATLAGLLVIVLISTIATASSTTDVDISFINHIQAELPEQDVFVVLNNTTPNLVYRIEGNDAKDPSILGKMVFTTANTTSHDPFKLSSNPLGPYPKGAELGISMEQWLAATGTGTYTIDGDNAEMEFSLQKLVANGTYTVWCSRLTFPPNVKVVDTACGAPDGSQNTLKADAQGNAAFNLKLKPLVNSTTETTSLIALAYHSDGKTHGSEPGDFGLNTHVQIFFMIPPPATPTPTPTPTSTPAPASKTPGFEGVLLISALLAIYFLKRY